MKNNIAESVGDERYDRKICSFSSGLFISLYFSFHSSSSVPFPEGRDWQEKSIEGLLEAMQKQIKKFSLDKIVFPTSPDLKSEEAKGEEKEQVDDKGEKEEEGEEEGEGEEWRKDILPPVVSVCTHLDSEQTAQLNRKPDCNQGSFLSLFFVVVVDNECKFGLFGLL